MQKKREEAAVTGGAAVRRTRSTLVIEPPGRWPTVDVGELRTYRELFFFLVWRDIKVRYAQTVLGMGWAILQPLMTMVVFTVIFGNFANIPSDGVPYAVFSFSAIVPWSYFSGSLSAASGSLVANQNLVTKVYFPRLIIPMSRVIAGLTNFVISFAILIVMLLAFGLSPSPVALVVVPMLILVMMMTAAGVGSLLAGLQVQYRDVGTVTGFLTQVWMYASPIVYPMSLVPEEYRLIYMLNPMVGVVEGFRSVLLGTQPFNGTATGIALLVSSILFIAGIVYFRKVEDKFADVV
jgi:lipopolysaccharide transport system permease protein